MTALPQYMASDDPEVLKAVRENVRRTETFFEKLRDLEKDLDSGSVYYFSECDGLFFSAVERRPEGRGDWTKGHHSRPYVSNKEEWARIGEVNQKWVEVPGVAVNAMSEDDPRTGDHFRMFPRPFERDGRAWLGYPSAPARGKRNGEMDPRWVEVLASEFHAAKEAAR